MSYSLIEQKIRELGDAVQLVSDGRVEVTLESEDFDNLLSSVSAKFGGYVMVGGGTGDPSAFAIAGVTIRRNI